MRSIRAFLLRRLLGGTALVLVGAGVVVFLLVGRSLEAQLDENLADRVLGFASILFQHDQRVEFEFSDELMPAYEPGAAAAYFEILYEDGRVLERSNSLDGEDLEVRTRPANGPVYWSAPLPDGRPGRYVAELVEIHHVYPEEGPNRPVAKKILVVVARGQEELAAAERRVMAFCAAVCLALILLIAVLSWKAVDRGLEPARRLATTLEAIRIEELPEQLEAGELPAELAPVAEKTDALIRRVAVALERERRTTADIAHELRTPISELITVAEVALRNGEDAAEGKRALGTVRDVAWRMGRSVSALLMLARLESGVQEFGREEVDLGGLSRELLSSLAELQRERELLVENALRAEDRVAGDPEVLRIILSNLFSNALYYSPPRGVVACRFHRSASEWSLTVENAAVDLRREDLRFLSEPFWRKDPTRTDRERSGLGLALSHALANRAGLKLEFEQSGGLFRAILSSSEPGGTEPVERADG